MSRETDFAPHIFALDAIGDPTDARTVPHTKALRALGATDEEMARILANSIRDPDSQEAFAKLFVRGRMPSSFNDFVDLLNQMEGDGVGEDFFETIKRYIADTEGT